MRKLGLLPLVLMALVLGLACGGDGAPSELRQTPLPTLQAGELQGEAAVYLSLGDSIQYGCCYPQNPQRSAHPAFARYLSQRLNRPVEWVTLAGNDTTVEFINGIGDQLPQLDRAVAVLEEYGRQGRDVVAITLSIGGNDLLGLRPVCQGRGGGDPECLQAFTDLLDRYAVQLDLIYDRLNEAKDPHTPILQLNVYDVNDCGRPGDDISASALGVRIFNGRIESGVIRNGAFLVDIYTPFKGKACEYIRDVDPTYAGYEVIAQEYQRVHESLAPEFVEPFVLPPPTP